MTTKIKIVLKQPPPSFLAPPAVDAFCNERLRFFYVESREKGKAHYYRFENGNQIIEYENYDNHIHCFWRTNNDFGKVVTAVK
jgi:hypothetical protein